MKSWLWPRRRFLLTDGSGDTVRVSFVKTIVIVQVDNINIIVRLIGFYFIHYYCKSLMQPIRSIFLATALVNIL